MLARKATAIKSSSPTQNPPVASVTTKVQVTAPEKVVIKKIKKGLLRKGFNSGLVSMKTESLDKNKEKQEEEIEDFSNRPRTVFTEVQFKKQWNLYIEKLKNEKRASLRSTLSSCRPEMGENFLLNMIFDNKVQESEFNNHKTDLLGFLRESLQNWGIQIESEVRVNEQKKKYYTNKERFERMMELNPKLADLRKRLNLDTDY